jgi:aerobic carbon-monoxide dehydrogenase small subunit
MTAELRDISLTVNGKLHHLQVEPRRLLVHCLRQDLGLTGTHIGCETAQCGACTVLLNGQAVKACNLLAIQVDGGTIVTIEGLAADNGHLHPIQEAFHEKQAVQCGFCTPGMIMFAQDLLQQCPHPDEGEIRGQMQGNLCRCTGYQHIVEAIQRAGELLAAGGKAR